MSRRRTQSSQVDSLDLLLDTVSNVFGGVMFLTLLAALLILTRGSAVIAEREVETTVVDEQLDSRLIAIEMRQTAAAIEAQRKTLARLDPDGSIAVKSDRLKSLRQTIAVARRQQQRAASAVADRGQQLEDQQTEQSELEEQIQELKEAVAEKLEQVSEIRAEAERTVQFRPLTPSRTNETVVILRYGRWYLLYAGTFGDRLNDDDFFVLESSDDLTTITPKPHRGQRVSDESLDALLKRLKRSSPPRRFHITIAVWDDSFADFNPLKDALVGAGYQYRTLPCDSTSWLTNQGAVDPFVQ